MPRHAPCAHTSRKWLRHDRVFGALRQVTQNPDLGEAGRLAASSTMGDVMAPATDEAIELVEAESRCSQVRAKLTPKSLSERSP